MVLELNLLGLPAIGGPVEGVCRIAYGLVGSCYTSFYGLPSSGLGLGLGVTVQAKKLLRTTALRCSVP